MTPEVQKVYDHAKSLMDKAISHLETELTKIRAGKANPSLLDNVQVDYYGNMVPINQAANVNTQDARTLVIQPWEKAMLTPIEKAIQAANLGMNPQNDGILIRISIPPLTEERRRDLAKKAKQEAEEAKVGIRTARKDAMEGVKKLKSSGLPEDEAKDAEAKIQNLTDQFVSKCDKHLEAKEKEIMTV
ncbi:MAG TPA: ribosome recycling factor [Bacteroidia bacterium]|jgi:ribosome recycling factor|nr:ribosome recycling factor [Bacteroidia bacterium]